MRIKTRWSKQDKERTIEEFASVLAFLSRKSAADGVLALENKGYETKSNAHRFQIMGEFLAFSLQVVDRLAYEQLDEDKRQGLIPALAQNMISGFVENQDEILGEGAHRKAFIDLLNQRGEEYAELSFRNGEGGFDFLRYFGEQVAALTTEKQFVSQQVMEIEAPKAISTLKKGMKDLFNDE